MARTLLLMMFVVSGSLCAFHLVEGSMSLGWRLFALMGFGFNLIALLLWGLFPPGSWVYVDPSNKEDDEDASNGGQLLPC